MPKSNPKKSTSKPPAAAAKQSAAKADTSAGQLTAFDKAMKLFHKREFQAALALFDEATKGTDVTIAHAAQLHLRMCRQRLGTDAPQLKTAEDFYAFGLALTSRREYGLAEQNLQRALQMTPKADHVLYSLALVKGLQGDIPAAAGYLERAIGIQPSNRSTARTDPDFHELLQHQQIRELVY